MYSIQIVDKYNCQSRYLFGLDIQGPASEFPLLVGCSLRTPNGTEIDQPALWLASPGRGLREVKITAEFHVGELGDRAWQGQVIFALWRDDSFSQRLADTGWQPWYAQDLVGSSPMSADYRDDHIQLSYGKRLDVWSANR